MCCNGKCNKTRLIYNAARRVGERRPIFLTAIGVIAKATTLLLICLQLQADSALLPPRDELSGSAEQAVDIILRGAALCEHIS